MKFERAAGILLHPTSLPSPYGIGDFGREAYEFVDFLASAGQRYWQVLPLGPTGYGDSPYQCFSAFAGNPWLISPAGLVADGLLDDAELLDVPSLGETKVDYAAVGKYKTQLLQTAFERFRATENRELIDSFHKFCDENGFWLEDYALFRAIKSAHGEASWQDWPDDLKLRRPAALALARIDYDAESFAEKFRQFAFYRQWTKLRAYANAKGVRIVGDIPIFVALDSSDAWCQPDQFKLNEDGSPKVVAGVPPDYFSKTGQRWGNPIYNWDVMRQDGFKWWIERVRQTLKLVDVIRIDHFRGFVASWEVPGTDETAENGAWVDVPGRDLFSTLRWVFGDLPVLAEDLGVITGEVRALRDEFGFPGMRILQFGFGGDEHSLDLPHNYPVDCCVYTGTHDNDTTVGWFDSQVGVGSQRDAAEIERERQFCLDYLNSDGLEIHWDFVRAALASVAATAIIPMQDLLGLGSDARMNLPATTSGNWQWRCEPDDFTDAIAERLGKLTRLYGRFAPSGN